MITEHWIMLYLFVNGTLCFVGGSDDWDDPFTFQNIGKGVIGAAFALPITLFTLGYASMGMAAKWLDGLVQFRTYWYYVFDRKRLIVKDQDILLIMHQRGKQKHSTNSIRDRLWRRAERIIHRENGFTPTNTEAPTSEGSTTQ